MRDIEKIMYIDPNQVAKITHKCGDLQKIQNIENESDQAADKDVGESKRLFSDIFAGKNEKSVRTAEPNAETHVEDRDPRPFPAKSGEIRQEHVFVADADIRQRDGAEKEDEVEHVRERESDDEGPKKRFRTQCQWRDDDEPSQEQGGDCRGVEIIRGVVILGGGEFLAIFLRETPFRRCCCCCCCCCCCWSRRCFL